MNPYNSFNLLHLFRLLLIISVIWCFNEPCIDDSSCSKQGFHCRFGHCLCPTNQFWAGYEKHCIQCPTKWINLIIFCVYYEREMTKWENAERQCRQMSNGIDEKVRLLELNDINEFYFIQKSIKQILTDDQMNSNNGIISSATAFIGSQRLAKSDGKWTYRWGENNDKIYSSTSKMWCPEIQWSSTTFEAEPAWERDQGIEITFQALKRWSDPYDACLVSLLSTSTQPYLCEIVGETGRLRNLSISSFLFTTQTSTSSSTTPTKQIVITNFSSLIFTQQLSTSNLSSTTSIKFNLTNEESESKQKGLLFIIIGIIGVVSLVIICIIIINMKYRTKEPSIDSKLTTKESLSRFKNDKKEDIQSNDSFESGLSAESTAQKSEQSRRISADKQSLPTPQSKSNKATKLALWDEMESSLFSSTLHDQINQ